MSWIGWVIGALAGVIIGMLIARILRGHDRGNDALVAKLDAIKSDNERIERALREEQRAGRGELAKSFEHFAERMNRELEGFARRLNELSQANDKHLGEIRTTLEAQLKQLREGNTKELERMRATVDEKLQTTLETRLGQSFKQVSERLEAVQRGLGEMQSLATGVGDLKRVLTNVKTRGTFGEVQLGALLEQLLTADQYASNVATVPGSSERVEYAIRLPGGEDEHEVYLPVDAKFPVEDYQRLVEAQEAADGEAAAAAGKTLENTVKTEAKRIQTKYIYPPNTTDFAVMFLATEGLYAEVIRRPGLFETLQRDHHVTVTGPTTLSALLNSLQMGFRTLAIQKRSSEIWKTLGAVKSEFGKFAGILEKAEKQIGTVSKSLGDASRKTRTIERRLKSVESLSSDEAQKLLGDGLPPDNDESNDAA